VPGWYDFTRRDPNSNNDGARFITEGDQVVGIELIITDNAFGDNNMAVDRIFDPGAPVFAVTTAIPEPTPVVPTPITPDPTPVVPTPIAPDPTPVVPTPVAPAQVVPAPEPMPIITPPVQFTSIRDLTSDLIYIPSLPYAQPIFQSVTFEDPITLQFVPTAYVLDEVDNVRHYKKFAVRTNNEPLVAEHILYVLPAVNASQTETMSFAETLQQVLTCPLGQTEGCVTDGDQDVLPSRNEKNTGDKNQVKQGDRSATQKAAPADAATEEQPAAEDAPAPQPSNDAKEPTATRVKFSDQLQLAARQRSASQRVNALHL
jgi:hypothetical protein